MIRRPRPTLAHRLWSRVQRADPSVCWPFDPYGCDEDGYGRIRVGRRVVRAHQIAYELTHGAIPAGRMVRHSCDNPPCCNPRHLQLGTHADNARDMVERGRSLVGERNPQHRLTTQQVLHIRRLRAFQMAPRAIGARTGVPMRTVYLILKGVTWKHV